MFIFDDEEFDYMDYVFFFFMVEDEFLLCIFVCLVLCCVSIKQFFYFKVFYKYYFIQFIFDIGVEISMIKFFLVCFIGVFIMKFFQ